MCNIDSLNIDFKSLTEGEHAVAARLDSAFFQSIEESEISQGDVHVDVSIRKTDHFSDLRFRAVGTVQLPCDRCLDPVDIDVDAKSRFTVKIGPEYAEDDEIITVAEDDSVLDVSWLVFEAIVLSLPVKHVHAPGKCNPAMIDILNQNSATRSDDTAEATEIDPRWAKLADLKLEN